MKCLIVFALVAISVAVDYEQVLQSPGELKALFNEYNSKYGRTFSAAEAPLRIRIFKNDLKQVVRLNKETSWTSGLNQFSAMTHEEKWQHLGLNVSRITSHADVGRPMLNSAPTASGVDWRARGKVTGIKQQGGCGSCWAFSAVAALETNYAIKTGRRKQFAEQEILDCAYEGKWDGCEGGFFTDGWDYCRKSGRLATQAAAPYKEKDGRCSYSWKHNGLQAAVITGSRTVPRGERNVLSYLNSGAVGVAFEVTDDFFKYKKDIIRDNSCRGHANHAVAAVGYTRDAMIVRNSWGSWGRNGYFYTARNHHGCHIYDQGAVPVWKSTGKKDTDPEYVPTDDDECNGKNADGCPCGTMRCSDGSCKHAHMCH